MFCSLLSLLFRYNIESEFPKRLNSFLLFYCIDKIIYLLLAIVAYYLYLKTGLNIDIFIISITLLITIYVIIIAILCLIGYINFCRRKNSFINPYDYMLIRLAARIELKQIKRYHIVSRLPTDSHSYMKKAIDTAATNVILYNKQLKKSLNIIVIYYCSIFYVLFLAYDYVYFKVTDITFERFWQAIVWTFPSLQ